MPVRCRSAAPASEAAYSSPALRPKIRLTESAWNLRREELYLWRYVYRAEIRFAEHVHVQWLHPRTV